MEQDNLEWVMRFQGDRCVICNLGFQDEKSTTVSLFDFSKKHNRSELAAYLTECIEMTPVGTVLVHQKCHRNFTDHKRVMHRGEKVTELPCKKKLRSSFCPFNWKEDCMLCGKCAVVDTRHSDRAQVKW